MQMYECSGTIGLNEHLRMTHVAPLKELICALIDILLNRCLEIILSCFMVWVSSRALDLFALMRRKEHARDCNHFYIIQGQCCIIRKG